MGENPDSQRLKNLTAARKPRQSDIEGYSQFIRKMKMALPLAAAAITVIVFVWSNQGHDIAPIKSKDDAPRTIGKNELLNPRFESVDDKNQPYTITAERAVQGETNDSLIVLEKPLGDVLLNSGNWIAIQSQKGAYWQDTQKLLLQNNVEIFHDEGYYMNTEALNIDLRENQSWTDTKVTGHGPAGTLESIGLRGDTKKGLLTLGGPARLVLYNVAKDQGLGGLAQ